MLRATVADTARCLGDLSTAQRRVLSLRAGLGAGPARSRGGVAKRLRISERRVARLERTGLRRLRTLDRAGACAPPASETFTAADADVAPSGAGSAAPVANPARTTGEPATGKRVSTPRERSSGGSKLEVPPAGAVAGESTTNPSGAIDLTIPLLVLLLAAIAAVAAHQLRRDTPAVALTRALRADPEAVEALKRARDDDPAAAAAEAPRTRWIPWHRSTMRGPGWNDPRPPSDRPGEWSADQRRRSPAPPPEPDSALEHEEWTPPERRTSTRRH